MNLWELFLIAVGLSMDAFAVSICKGLSTGHATGRQAIVTGLWFGGFQAAMPLGGYLLGVSFSSMIKSIDHWIAFVLLSFIGISMIREALSKEHDCEDCSGSFDIKTMLPLAVATSIDALAVGVTFAFLHVSIVPAVSFIGIITFLLSVIGLKAGNVIGSKNKSRAEFAGGAVLVLIGVKILLEHLGILTF